jgi:hypothetical protein
MDERGDQLVQQAMRNLSRAAQRKKDQAAGDHK